MSPHSPEAHKAFTPEQVNEWMSATEKKRLELYLLAAEPLYNSFRESALIQMSELLKEAIEEVRVVSASLQEESKALRLHASELREYSTELIERSPQPRGDTPHE